MKDNILWKYIKKAIRRVIRLEKRPKPSIEFCESDNNVRSDEYIRWINDILGGFLTGGNIRAFDYAIRNMPEEGAVVEIGSLFGLSTNIIAYLLIKYHRNNPFFT